MKMNREEKRMDNEAIIIVENYVQEQLKKRGMDPEEPFETYIVWKCKALQNWKYLIGTDVDDTMYYELTYNGDKKEWYLDAYMLYQKKVIQGMFS
jgi:hypothetical protein